MQDPSPAADLRSRPASLQTFPPLTSGGLARLVARPAARHPWIDPKTECVWACLDCARACNEVADSFPQTTAGSPLARVVWLSRNGAGICLATARMLTTSAELDVRRVRAVLETCQSACRLVRVEIAPHAKGHLVLRIGGAACRRCEAACGRLSKGI